jgi:dTDP-glucose pyrophosphorylase
MAAIEKGEKQIALVVEKYSNKLVGVVTDGDLRRAVLENKSFRTNISTIMKLPIACWKNDVSAEVAISMMHERNIRHLPVVGEHGELIDLMWYYDLVKDDPMCGSAVVMVGGFGKRLRPLTDEQPKPLLDVQGKPILELIVQNLEAAGIEDVCMVTHYKKEKIKEHFKNGKKFGVSVDYIDEEEPLGTAGALYKMKDKKIPFLVINGDILTNLNLAHMYRSHIKNGAHITIGVSRYTHVIPFGVVECEGKDVISVKEKPAYDTFVIAGVYVLSPFVCGLIPENKYMDMPDLIKKAIGEGHKVVGFPILGYWYDIGRHKDYEEIQEEDLW